MSFVNSSLFAASIAFSAQASANHPVRTFDCRAGDGISLCRKFVEVQSLQGGTCSGNICYEKWNRLFAKTSQLVQEFNATFKDINAVTPEALATVKLATTSLCGMKYTGLNHDWASYIMARYQDFMQVSAWIQFVAKDPKAYTCTPKIN